MIKLVSKIGRFATNYASKFIKIHSLLVGLTYFRYASKIFYQHHHKLPELLVVSLTSYPPRFKTLGLTIKTLLSQSVIPDIVILWIYESDYQHLPENILKLKSLRFEIRTTSEDLRSYKKIVPALLMYPNEFIVTADDDIYYNYDWLEELTNNYDPNLNEVVGHRGHRITYNLEGVVNPYANWKWCIGSLVKGNDIFLTGCGGVLYPPKSLSVEVIDSHAFMHLCPTADDVWLYFMARINGYSAKKIPSYFREFSWIGSQDVALNAENVDKCRNDECIKNLEKIYGNI